MNPRLKQGVFLLATGCLGAVFAVVVDGIAAGISPEYFSVGKGIEAGDGFLLRVAWLAGRVGFIAGVVAGLIVLLVNRPRRGRGGLPYSRLIRQAWKPLACSAVLGSVLGIVADRASAPLLPPFDFIFRHVPKVLSPDRVHLFNSMWYVHLGLYLGLAVGIALVAITVRRVQGSEASPNSR